MSYTTSALRLLGECWRSDWSEFDGRTLRSQLDDIADIAQSEEHMDRDAAKKLYGSFMMFNEICPDHACWDRHCRERHP